MFCMECSVHIANSSSAKNVLYLEGLNNIGKALLYVPI